MNSVPEKITLSDWEEFGGGYTADSFYHKTDKTIMMKLYAPFVRSTEALYELEFSEKVEKLGLDIAKPLKYVISDDGRYGAIFERLQNKRSIARILADEPERLDEMAKLFADETKKLHQTECDTTLFNSIEERILQDANGADFITDKLKSYVTKVINNTPKVTTCLHGDLHIGNLVLSNDKPVLIDLGDFSYGSPLYDLGLMYFQAYNNDEETCMRVYHINVDTYRRFFGAFAGYYFEDETNLDEILKPYVIITAVRYFIKLKGKNDNLSNILRDYL